MISGLPHMSFRFSALRAALTIETVVAIDHEVGVHPREVHQRTVTSPEAGCGILLALIKHRSKAGAICNRQKSSLRLNDCVNRATNESGKRSLGMPVFG
jgi:hypothetical protein